METFQDVAELLDNFMWDLKLCAIDLFFFLNNISIESIFTVLNGFDPALQNGFYVFNWKSFYQFSQNMVFFFSIKFLISIGFLILIRGGTPRYRYDYLTKLGWLKFLGFVIIAFFSSLLLFFAY